MKNFLTTVDKSSLKKRYPSWEALVEDARTLHATEAKNNNNNDPKNTKPGESGNNP
ncbi:hypothetical protein THRCLA_21165 [Thraustotheca clavata]|uniref:Uncharacterized protein n=1 Tax=Thraustotheca clavata TaxID=74557 RepID=A0A1V9ZZR9_9STRA|nr:hypothetical protein THRCLA_21165 [Thraustotheca clavata]